MKRVFLGLTKRHFGSHGMPRMEELTRGEGLMKVVVDIVVLVVVEMLEKMLIVMG